MRRKNPRNSEFSGLEPRYSMSSAALFFAMPLFNEQFLRQLAGKKGKEQAQSVATQRATGALHGQLARSQKHATENAARLEAIVAAADAQHKNLQAQISALRQKTEGAAGEERDEHHRNYLRAVQNLHSCARAYGAAKRELIIARNF